MNTDRKSADLVLRGGTIVTMDGLQPLAQAIAASGDRIVAVGNDNDVAPLVGPGTRVIDLLGCTAFPGFIDSHCHFTGIGHACIDLALASEHSWEDVVERVAEAAQASPPGKWIHGFGWHASRWTRPPSPCIGGGPTNAWLNEAAPSNPVRLAHASGHAVVVNALAMEHSGIRADTKDPQGGEIVRNAEGNPTGLLREKAVDLVHSDRGAGLDRLPTNETAARLLVRRSATECLSHGLTSVHDAGSSLAAIDLYRKMACEGALDVRLWTMIHDELPAIVESLPHSRQTGDRLTVRAIKCFMDGALGTHGAWMLDPYTDKPGARGNPTTPLEQIRKAARLAAAHGLQLCIHAIGDRANREALNIFEATFHGEKRDWRWRIEHAQHISVEDIPRFGALGVIASVQGIHCIADAPYVVARLGERRAAESAYAWKSLLRGKARLANGTDAPVESIDPIANYHAMVTRRLPDGSRFFPEQRLSRMEALRACTLDAAFAAFEDDIKGSLSVGKLADVTVLSRDITTVPEEEIREARIVFTIVGGRVMFEA